MSAQRQHIGFPASRDGVRIAYAKLGKGSPLVRAAHFLTHLDHDLGSPVWRPWLDELSRNNTLVRYDGRGCGLSDRTCADLSLEAAVADIEAAVDAAGIEKFALLGGSQGSAISIAYRFNVPVVRLDDAGLLSGSSRHRQPGKVRGGADCGAAAERHRRRKKQMRNRYSRALPARASMKASSRLKISSFPATACRFFK
ncbi:MAG: alpha/beta hydrolase [Betaproteobacteria bacterium]|nr:alpha/beta hydrolase [Betaproteobacteria bacterium]